MHRGWVGGLGKGNTCSLIAEASLTRGAGGAIALPAREAPSRARISSELTVFLRVVRPPSEIPTGLDLLRRISREDLASRCPEISYPKFAASALLRVAMGYLFLLNVLVVLVYAEGVIEIFYDVSLPRIYSPLRCGRAFPLSRTMRRPRPPPRRLDRCWRFNSFNSSTTSGFSCAKRT